MIGIVTGAGGSEIYRVASEGVDTFITGEAPHWAAVARRKSWALIFGWAGIMLPRHSA